MTEQTRDPWDELEPPVRATPTTTTTSLPPEERLDGLAHDHAVLSLEYERLGERLGQLEREIAHFFPEQAGDVAKTTGRYEIIVSRSERWSWDKEALEEVFTTGAVPDYVKRTLSIDKRKYLRLSASEQDAVKHALTRKLDNPKVKVIPNV